MIRLSYASTKNRDIFYVVRMDISDEFFLLETDEKTYVFLDNREYGVFLEKNKNPDIEVVLLNPLIDTAEHIEGSETMICKVLSLILDRYASGQKEVAVSACIPLPIADYLRSHGFSLVLQNPLYPARAVKKEWEIEAIENALKKTCKAYEKIEALLRASEIVDRVLVYHGKELTSEFLKKEAERVLFEEDMASVEGMVISSGLQTAIAHHPGCGVIEAHVPIVVDMYPISKESGYFADMTRTYLRGTSDMRLPKMYDAVLRAQQAAFLLIRPGVTAKELHEAACNSFLQDGFDVGDKGFTHAIGHGLGLDIHEFPRVGRKTSTPLEVGNVFTVEPGLYYPEVGGVRIEDVVVVTQDGYRNLTNYPKTMILA